MNRERSAQREASSSHRRRHGMPTPTVAELVKAPELATLHALDELTQIAIHALVAVHPELGQQDAVSPGDIPATTLSCARHIVYDVRRLELHLREYRNAIVREQERIRDVDHDLPF